jgi:adenylate cyclase
MNLDEMDGIVDLSRGYDDFRRMNGEASSPGSGFESSWNSSSLSTSDTSFHPLTQAPPSQMYSSMNVSAHHMGFRDPFSPSSIPRRKGPPAGLDLRKGVSPKTIVPVAPLPPSETLDQHSPGWVAPESWAVEKEGEAPEVPDYTTSDEEDTALKAQIKQQRRRTKVNRRGIQPIPTYQIRIHRKDNTYHVVKLSLTTTVAELIPVMNRKLVLDSTRETHSLYVKERERGTHADIARGCTSDNSTERVLAPTERPAGLVKRRLEQAGYDAADGLQTLGSDEIGFLIKFIYKSNLLGGAGV